MIFVTVGSTLPFDALIRVVDEAAGEGQFGDNDVFFQTGRSVYQPVHGRSVVSLPNIRPLIRDASMIICHGGMTIFECILFEKPFIAVPNPTVSDNHQFFFLRALSEQLPIVWAVDPAKVPELFKTHPKMPIDLSQLERPYRDMAGFLSVRRNRDF